MEQPLPTGVPTHTVPSFYITGRQPLRPGAILLATVAAVAALSSVLYALGHTGHAPLTSGNSGAVFGFRMGETVSGRIKSATNHSTIRKLSGVIGID